MLNSSVLVLNRHYQPIHIDDQYRLYDFDDWAALSAANDTDSIATVQRRIRVPRVLVLTAFEKIPKVRVRFSRINIYTRDQDTCQYCGRQLKRSDLNLDHVRPRSQGGTTCWENVVCSCIECNLRKGGRTPEQAHMKLLRAPERPKWTSLFRAGKGEAHRAWLPFMNLPDASYWNVELKNE